MVRSGQQAAAGGDGEVGDEGCLVAAQPERGGGHLLRQPEPPQRQRVGWVLAGGIAGPLELAGADRPRGDGVDAAPLAGRSPALRSGSARPLHTWPPHTPKPADRAGSHRWTPRSRSLRYRIARSRGSGTSSTRTPHANSPPTCRRRCRRRLRPGASGTTIPRIRPLLHGPWQDGGTPGRTTGSSPAESALPYSGSASKGSIWNGIRRV